MACIHRALSSLRAKQTVLVLEFLQPGTSQDLVFAFGTSACTGEKESLLLDHLVIQWVSLALVVSRPVRQGLLNIRDTTLGALDGRPTAIIGVEIFFLLAQEFGNGTTCRLEQGFPHERRSQLPSFHAK